MPLLPETKQSLIDAVTEFQDAAAILGPKWEAVRVSVCIFPGPAPTARESRQRFQNHIHRVLCLHP